MTSFFTYWFWPNPGLWTYGSPVALSLLVLSGFLIVLSVALSRWRRGLQNSRTRLLSRSWSGASLWFGVVALVLTVSRIEYIQFFAMRVLWIVWLLAAVLYLGVQILQFRKRHYTVIPQARVFDERDKYLPRRK